MSDQTVRKVLDYLHGKPVNASEEMLKKFRRDAGGFYRFFMEKPELIKTDAVLLFGERDVLTFPAAFRWKRWKEYFEGKVEYHILPERGHFFLKRDSAKISEIIRKMID